MASILSILSLSTAVAAQSGHAIPTEHPLLLAAVDNFNLIVATNLVILSFIISFAIWQWPRFLIRFSRKSEWSLGHILRAVPSTGAGDRWKRNFSAVAIPDTLYKATMETGSEDSHTWHTHNSLKKREAKLKHHPSHPSQSRSGADYIQLASAVLNRSAMMPGYTVGRFLIVLGYCLIILVVSLYRSNPFLDYVRTGYVALGQIPIVFALATKNNILGMMVALGYEKLNYLHRTVGQLIAITSNIHALGYMYNWSMKGTVHENIIQPKIYSVIISLMGLNLLVFFSTSFWRQKYYNVFMISHIVGFTTFITGLCSHTPSTVPWVVAALIIYAIDHVTRIIKSRICEATLRPISELGLTRVEIPRLNAGWRAGQHVRVRVISSGMGRFGWTEVHPFTIASVGGDGMLLMCKKTGSWTTKLYNIATSSSPAEKGVNSKSVKVILEGPYGGVGHTLMDSFSGALFVVGGSGITFALASIQELIQKDIDGKSNVKVIDLVWCVQSPGFVMSMLPTFEALVQQAPLTSVRVSVHYTRASSGDDPNKLYGYLPSNIVLTPGRPRLSNVLNEIIDHTCAVVPIRSGLFIGVCGPMSLGEQLRQAVSQIDDDCREAVGGVELCEEIFGW